MACQILPLIDGRAVLADSTTDWAFGPLFPSPEDAHAFLRWLGIDPRDLMMDAILHGQDADTALERRYLDWHLARQRAPA